MRWTAAGLQKLSTPAAHPQVELRGQEGEIYIVGDFCPISTEVRQNAKQIQNETAGV
jgi:hypothetical protein